MPDVLTLGDAAKNGYPSVFHLRGALRANFKKGMGVDDLSAMYKVANAAVVHALEPDDQVKSGFVDGGWKGDHMPPRTKEETKKRNK